MYKDRIAAIYMLRTFVLQVGTVRQAALGLMG